MSVILNGESPEHRAYKLLEAEKLINLGYRVQTEKKLFNPKNKKNYIIVDVYGEKDDSIAIREIVKTSYSGKDPHDYLETNKTVDFQIIKTENSKVTLKNMTKPHRSHKGYTTRLINPEFVRQVKGVYKSLDFLREMRKDLRIMKTTAIHETRELQTRVSNIENTLKDCLYRIEAIEEGQQK